MLRKRREVEIQSFYELKIGEMWRYFRTESLAFWAICAYLFLEYVRPQSIYPALNILPWTQLAVLFALFGCFQDRSVKWVSSPINIFLIVFFILIGLSSALAYWPKLSIDNLQNFYTWFFIYFLIVNIVNNEKRIFIFFCVFLLASAKLSISLSITWAKRGFSFTDWGLSGPPGFFQNSGELAIQMLVFWPLAFGFLKFLKPNLPKFKYYLLLSIPVSAMMVVLGASSRGAQLALLIQLIFMNFRYIFRFKILLSSVIVLSALWLLLPEEQKQRFEFAGDDRTSIQRLLYWENGYEMMNDHPISGVGYFNFIPYYERFFSSDMLYDNAELPHNIFIQVGADLGYPALLIYLCIIIYAFVQSRKSKRELTDVGDNSVVKGLFDYLNVSLVGFVVAGQFVSVVYYPFLWIHLAFYVMLSHVAKEKLSTENQRNGNVKRWIRKI